ncbi:ATPase component of various ABC-type transport system, containing duplicated ATPase [Rubidibacter lacunae KORDI 51-2]|uniref:ATPase component of various ABC-type transport system, containing duplicated ATPase n=1 Tax=Rubidibacter lacunae KORDI 51-2 TaxID=582515 RepID=U5DKQ3_9CHRO|nr:ABC transporter ATP-binding protein [Rubidibacter lacunae]ERN41134.1 ATPase component of various ABC-type transport system, containing duplicated ATPase [Rubidibacter lacunae KORDI 51-2]
MTSHSSPAGSSASNHPETSPLLAIDDLRVAYTSRSDRQQSTRAIDGVSLELAAGERLGLVGESGCGKSTLGRAAVRLLPNACLEGSIRFRGESVLDFSPARLRQFRGEAIALVFQDPMTRLDPLMTIGEHCLETLHAHQPHLSYQQAKTKALQTLLAVKIPAERWAQYPHEFSGGMRQRVAIALALLLDPQLIVADEPTTSLDVTVAAEILQELTRLCRERQLGLLLISHDLAMVAEYCDRVAVMHTGKIVEIGPARQILGQPQHDYTRSLLQAARQIQVVSPEEYRPPEAQTPLLRVRDLHQHFTLEQTFLQRFVAGPPAAIEAVNGVSFDLLPGEVFGLVGESGCGKSTLSRTILQLLQATSGSVEFCGQDLTQLSMSELRLLRRQMQMIFQDPLACLNPQMRVGDAIADPLFVHGLATAAEAKQQVAAMLERVGLTPVEDYAHRFPRNLSGGQQQRVAIARALILRPRLLICDEPVSMLDASVQTQVLQLMQELRDEFELTYLFITHDLWVARYLCDRIAVMYRGKVVELGPTEDIFQRAQHPYTQKLLGAAPQLSVA